MSRRVDLALGLLCVLFVIEAAFFAPVNADAAFTLRQARAQAEGALPCRDLYCEYTPLATTLLALVRGALVPSLLIVQAVILLCAVLTYRLARTVGRDVIEARRALLLTWALLIANDGRGIEVEPFAVACLLCAVNSFAASTDRSWSFSSGLWVAAAFWAKQYGLLGWVGLVAVCAWEGRFRAAAGMSAGAAVGIASGFLLLLGLGSEAAAFESLFRTGAYPNYEILANLTAAPELLGMLLLTLTAAAAAAGERESVRAGRILVSMSAAAMLPFAFRGYRHYWHFAIPFLVLLLVGPQAPRWPSWVRLARGAAIGLAILSVGLDVGRCARDLVTGVREVQLAKARRLVALSEGSSGTLYLVDPSLLALVNAPILAPGEVGPKFTRFSRAESEAVLAAARTVVWDRSFDGADQLLGRLSKDPLEALASRGFVLARAEASVEVYSRTAEASPAGASGKVK